MWTGYAFTNAKNNPKPLYTTLHYTTQYYTTLHNSTPFYTTLHNTTQLYTILHNPMLPHAKQYLLFFVAFFLISCEGNTPTFDQPSPMQKSAKRGVSFDFKKIDDLPILSPSVSWSYNWGNSQNATAALWFDTNQMDFCPMCWNNSYSADKIRQYVQEHPNTKYLLGFNEPNLTDQCNMTPTQAAEHWPQVVALAKELNLLLISPAMNYGTLAGYHDPIKWLDEFFALPNVSLDDIHAIAIHCYMASPSAVKDYIKKFEKYGKPIWMTEFCAWDPVPSNVEKQMDYMCSVLNHMEQNPHVERYAWFMPRTSGKVDSAPYMQLLTHGSPVELTPLGQIFTQFSSFDKNAYLALEKGIGAHQYIALKEENISLRVTDNNQLYIQSFMQGQWIDYQINVQSKQPLQIQYATIVNSQVCIYIDGVAQAIVDMPKTADMQSVTTLTTTVIPPLGNHTLRLEALKGTFNCYQLLQ